MRNRLGQKLDHIADEARADGSDLAMATVRHDVAPGGAPRSPRLVDVGKNTPPKIVPCALVSRGNTSITVKVVVDVSRQCFRAELLVTEAQVVYVNVGEDGNPRPSGERA